MRTDTVVLIGPIGTGKSTVAALLAERMGVPRHPMDDDRWRYYEEIGYSKETEKTLREGEGFSALARYWKPFEAHAVERILEEHRDCVIDFGAGHSVYDDAEQFTRVERALADYAHVVLLLPSPDLDRSVGLLRERTRTFMGWDGVIDGFDWHEHFVKHPSNHRLAKKVVYSEGKTAEQTCEDVLAAVRAPG